MVVDYLKHLDKARKSSSLRHEIKGTKSLMRRFNKEIRKIKEEIVIEAKNSAILGRQLIDKESKLISAEIYLKQKEEELEVFENQSLDL